MKIPVTAPYLPPFQMYEGKLASIWEAVYLTNQGPFARALEKDIASALDVPECILVSNGTVALELALRALGIEGEVITTPFTFIATSNSILSQKCTPVYADIDPATLCIDPEAIESAITSRTAAIMATHVFGNVCAIEDIQTIARKHDIPVIYDGAHAFGGKYQGQSVLGYGDVSTCSFHATKLFHTVEGGGVFSKSEGFNKRVRSLRQFGLADGVLGLYGTNAKVSELHAAMGACVLPVVPALIAERRFYAGTYDLYFAGSSLARPLRHNLPDEDYNYPYYPILFSDPDVVEAFVLWMARCSIEVRRYFHPSLDTLDPSFAVCPTSCRVAERIVCLPLYNGLGMLNVQRVLDAMTAFSGDPE